MTFVSAYAARTGFAELLRRVMKGEEVTITRHGVPVAVLSPPSARSRQAVSEVIAEIRRFRAGKTLGGLDLRDMIEEGRR